MSTETDNEIKRIRQKKIDALLGRKRELERLQELENDGRPVVLTDDNFGGIRKYPLILVDFWASWCGPCKMVAPLIEQLAQEYRGRIWFGKLNVDENPATSNNYGIQSIPAMLLFRNGVRVDRIVGAVPKRVIESKITPYLQQS